jgi:trimeric autotransporter adhesin
VKKNARWSVWGAVLLLACATSVWSQQSTNAVETPVTTSTSQLPRLVSFSGTLKDLNGNPLVGTVGVTFFLYSEQTGGAPLWLETQNVQPDKYGHYTVMLGMTKPDGLPVDLFVSEQAQWLGVQPQGQAEQARVLLL